MSEPTVEPQAVVPPFNWRVPVLGDVPNIPSDLTNLATDIGATVLKGIPIFANAAARDTAVPAPVDGQLCYLTDRRRIEMRQAPHWLAVSGSMPFAAMTIANMQLPANTVVTPTAWPALTAHSDYWSLTAGVLTISKPGFYDFRVRLNYDAIVTPGVETVAGIRINQTGLDNYTFRSDQSGSIIRQMSHWRVNLNAGDKAEARYWCENAMSGPNEGRWEVRYLGPQYLTT